MDLEGFGYRPSLRVGMFREMPGSDILKQGYLKKLKTMKKKFFVLRSTSSSGPARLDYYDSEKKFKANQPPKRSVHLHTCFNINKKSDTKHKYAIALYLLNDCFSVIAEDQEEQNRWLNLMLEYQSEYLLEGEVQKPHYDYVWQGVVKQKTPHSCPGIQGIYRLCLSDKSVSLVKVSDFKPAYDFMLSSIRRCGHSDNFFFMEVGRSSVTGPGELWMQVDETSIAQSMHNKVLNEMTSRQSDFRGRSNTSGSTISRRSTIHGDEAPSIRKRATSESHHGQGSPRRARGHTSQRPVSTVVYPRSLASEPNPLILPGSSPHSAFDSSFYEESRMRSDSMGSRSSRTSRHSDFADGSPYMNVDSITSPEHTFLGARSQTPETPVSITEEDPTDIDNSEYLPMSPGQRSMTPSPTRFHSQMERSTASGDSLPLTPTRRSGTPSPTRFIDRPGSTSSEPQDMNLGEGYMDMRPGSVVSSPASNSSGYIDMMPGQRTPTDPGPGYMIMDPGWSRTTAPIPIRGNKEIGYMDMGPSSQPLPTVKEGGSGEAYLPMSPAGQSPLSSEGLKPAKVVSYLSDDSMSGEFPKRAYSVGSRPTPKPTHRQHQIESLRRQPLDSSKSSSAPHLIVQKVRSPIVDPYNQNYMDMSSNASSLNQSLRSDDTDSFMEMDFYRPRTASDSYGCRPRSSSFGKQVFQGHRPRSSSYGQSSKMSKLVTSGRVDSFESVRRPSQDFINRKRSQESLSKYSCSSSESLKKFSEDMQKKSSVSSDYMDMGFDKSKATSPTVHGLGSPVGDPAGYVDMTLGSSVPKQRGISPSSSSHSLGSSPASGFGHQEKSHETTKVVHPSGIVTQKQGFRNVHPNQHSSEQQLKVVTSHLKQDKKSPASSGKESEDESYVPFQPGSYSNKSGNTLSGFHDFIHKSHPSVKIQHGYSRSYDSAMKHVESSKKSKGSKNKKEEKSKHIVPKSDKHEKESKGKKDKEKHTSSLDKDKTVAVVKTPLQEKVTKGHSPTIDRKIDFIPESDLFSNSQFIKSTSSPEQSGNKGSVNVDVSKADDSGYMEYLPGFDTDLAMSATLGSKDKSESVPKTSNRGSTGFTSSLTSTNTQTKPHFDHEVRETNLPHAHVDKVESDYVLSDPVSNLAIASETMSLNEKGAISQDDMFSYMDFDPAIEKVADKTEPVKSPVRVKSFIASPKQSGNKTSISKGSDSSSESQKCSTESTTHCGENKSCTNMKKAADNSVVSGTFKQTSNDKKQFMSKVGKTGSPVDQQKEGIDRDNNTVIDSKDTEALLDRKERNSGKEKWTSKSGISADELKAKFVVMNKSDEVMDEGYIELDFTPQPDKVKKHHRSGSSTSTTSGTSDRSVKLSDGCIEEGIPTPSPIVSYISVDSDCMPRPEVPVSYICDNTDSDLTVKCNTSECSSPAKLGGSRTSLDSGSSVVTKSPTSITGTSGLDTSQSGDVFNPPPVQPLNLSQANQLFGQFSRQSSMPLGPSYSPRTGEDIQSIRSRKASGPATLSGARKSSGGSGTIAKQLETLPAGQELQKQVSMPCMNVGIEKIRTGRGHEMGQRHSYTDLSQYEEMSPGNNLDNISCGGKSNSQQQLADLSQEKKLNYADLDLKGSSENVDEKSPRVNYATINFEKTESLKNSNAKEEVKFSI